MRKGLLIHNLKAGSLDVELLPKLVFALGEVVSVDIEQLDEAGDALQYAEASHPCEPDSFRTWRNSELALPSIASATAKEKTPLLEQLAVALGSWERIDQLGSVLPSDPASSMRRSKKKPSHARTRIWPHAGPADSRSR